MLISWTSASSWRHNVAYKVSRTPFRQHIPVVCCGRMLSWSVTASMPSSNASLRVEKINGYMTELMEICVETPNLRVIFFPGNPGVITFYKSYLDSLSELFVGKANIIGVGYLGHTSKEWEKGKLFSLEEQVEHKVEFVQNHIDKGIPLVLVGHSIGAYMALSVFKRFPDKVQHVVGLYPFIAINERSFFQSLLRWSLSQRILCETLSYFSSVMDKLPKTISRGFLKVIFGRGWSPFAVDVACQYLLQYSLVRNITYLGMTEFKKLQRHPDWEFLKDKQRNISILFGVDDHWGPLTLFEEMSVEAPNLDVEIERQGHDHAFCCTDEGSRWVAAYCAKTIKNVIPKLELLI